MTEHTDEKFMELLEITSPIVNAIEKMTAVQAQAAFGMDAPEVMTAARRFRIWQATKP